MQNVHFSPFVFYKEMQCCVIRKKAVPLQAVIVGIEGYCNFHKLISIDRLAQSGLQSGGETT